MRYWYVPSTYQGRKFGRGIYGGAIRGFGRIVGGALYVPPPTVPVPEPTPVVDIPVAPTQVVENIVETAPEGYTEDEIEKAKQIIAWAEQTGKPQPITEKQAGFWSGLKNLGSKAWSGVKAVASNPLVQTAAKVALPMAMGALMPYAPGIAQKAWEMGKNAVDSAGVAAAQKLNDWGYGTKAAQSDSTSVGDNVSMAMTNLGAAAKKGIVAFNNPTLRTGLSTLGSFFKFGKGYGAGRRYRRGRLRKGSPEAKAYMARLRAMRGRKRGGAIRGYGIRGYGIRGLGFGRRSSARARRAMIKLMGSGYSGGVLPGWTQGDMEALIARCENDGKGDDDEVVMDWVDRKGKNRQTTTTVGKLRKMHLCTGYKGLLFP